jgi:hypothetical protein
MARANRHYIPGHVWHITHRCHKKELLMKIVWDRRRWVDWLFGKKVFASIEPLLTYVSIMIHFKNGTGAKRTHIDCGFL